MSSHDNGSAGSQALTLVFSKRPRNVGWLQSAGLLFGDWGTSRLYVLGLAFAYAGGASLYLIMTMSLLVLAVGWAYAQICRIYPDGGGVYTAAKGRSRTLAVVGALLLFADYVVTASLSALDAFHYFDLAHQWVWAVAAIIVIGLFNFLGPKHTSAFALAAAIGMVVITLVITAGSIPQVHWLRAIPSPKAIESDPLKLWTQFVAIVLALSGVEAIANLTGVMKKPVAHTARKAIWTVAIEVAVFNVLLAGCMVAVRSLYTEAPNAHRDDMLAFLAGHYLNGGVEHAVRLVGGLLLLSATNTAITDMISVQYLMARDGELPKFLQALNRFGTPWVPTILAAGAPALLVAILPDVGELAHLYAMGLIGALTINITLCAFHPRLRRMRRKAPMLMLGGVLVLIWITLGWTKPQALLFVSIVLLLGLVARQSTKWWAGRKGPRPSLLRQAIAEQLTPEALGKPKVMVCTYGSESLAGPAVWMAKEGGYTLVVCFIREVTLSYKYESRLSIDNDMAAQRSFTHFLELGHKMGVSVVPVYDNGSDAAVLVAENAAIWAVERVMIGSSRKGTIYRLVKGAFQRRLEALLPPEIPVQVINPDMLSERARRELPQPEAPSVH